VVILDPIFSKALLSETRGLQMPSITYTNYFSTDIGYSFLFFGEADLYAKNNNFFYFLFLLKNLIYIDSWLKKKIQKKNNKKFSFKLNKKKKGFFRLKSSKPLKLFGGKFYNIAKRFKVRHRRINLRLNLIGKILMRYCKFKPNLLTRHSSYSFINRLKKNTNLIQYKKNLRFFFILERRLQLII
jgi:hypothetical protein